MRAVLLGAAGAVGAGAALYGAQVPTAQLFGPVFCRAPGAAGRLALTLTLPLGQLESSKVAGTYVFNNNRVVLEREIPPLEQASGRIEPSNRVFASGDVPVLIATTVVAGLLGMAVIL